MRDYWLSKLMFDLQQPEAARAYRADRAAVLARYPLSAEALRAVRDDDVAALAPRVNPYLLRFYFFAIGKPESWFVERIRALPGAGGDAAHG